MTDFERINQPRVEKIHAMLDTIMKSARSNNADPSVLLRPIRSRLLDETRATIPILPGADSVALPGAEPTPVVTPKSHWSDAIEMARTAPLSDAVAAMSVILTRIEEELN